MSAAVPWYFLPQFRPARLQDCVFWLEADSFNGGVWRNLAPNFSDRNHGTAHGGVGLFTWHPQFPPAPTFDGVNDYVEVPDDDSLDITEEGTLMCWFKALTNNVIQGLISKQKTDIGYTTPYALRLYNDQFAIRLGDGSELQDVKYTGVDTNKWYLFAGTWDGTNIRLFVNGELKKVDSQNLTPYINTASLKIAVEGPLNQLPFRGIIDEVRIYKAALTPAEVMHNYTHHPLYYLQRGIDPYEVIAAATAAAPSI